MQLASWESAQAPNYACILNKIFVINSKMLIKTFHIMDSGWETAMQLVVFGTDFKIVMISIILW